MSYFVIGFLMILIVSVILAPIYILHFLKSKNLRLLFVKDDGPGLLLTKDAMSHRFIMLSQDHSSFPIGELKGPKDLNVYDLGIALSKKDPLLLKNLIQPLYPKYFEVYETNRSLGVLVDLLLEARDTRRTKNIDSCIGLIHGYCSEIHRYYTHQDKMLTDPRMDKTYKGAISDYDLISVITKSTGGSTIRANQIFDSLHKPWKNAK